MPKAHPVECYSGFVRLSLPDPALSSSTRLRTNSIYWMELRDVLCPFNTATATHPFFVLLDSMKCFLWIKALTRTNTLISHWKFSPVFSIHRIERKVLALQAVRSDYVVLEAGQACIYDIWTTSWTHNENPKAIFITQPTLFKRKKSERIPIKFKIYAGCYTYQLQ